MLLLALLVAGCSHEGEGIKLCHDVTCRAASISGADDAAEAAGRTSEFPPAWDDSATTGKADEASEMRESKPELFGLTSPPVPGSIPVPEYWPVDAVMVRPGGSIGGFHESIIRALDGHVEHVWLLHESDQRDSLMAETESFQLTPGFVMPLNIEKTDSNWVRDYGPISLLGPQGALAFVDFRYYVARPNDDAVATRVADAVGAPVSRPPMSFEGGNLMVDGLGRCHMTQKVFTQNASASQSHIEAWLKSYLGCSQLVVVQRPEALGTGHIDMFAKLVGPQSVIIGRYDEQTGGANAGILDDIAAQYGQLDGDDGVPLTVLRVPMPPVVDGVWYTYTNSLIANNSLLMSVFPTLEQDPAVAALREQAAAVYKQALPGVEVFEIPSDGVIRAGGAVHCMTMGVARGSAKYAAAQPELLCDFNDILRCQRPGLWCGGGNSDGECEGDGTLRYCGSDGYPRRVSCGGGCAVRSAGGAAVAECVAAENQMQEWGTLDGSEGGEHGEGIGSSVPERGCNLAATEAWGSADAEGGDHWEEVVYEVCPDGPCVDGQCSTGGFGACEAWGPGCHGAWAIRCPMEGEPSATLCALRGEVCIEEPDGATCGPWDELDSQGALCPWPGMRRCGEGGVPEICSVAAQGGPGRWVELEGCWPESLCLDGVCVSPIADEEDESDEPGSGCGISSAGGRALHGFWTTLLGVVAALAMMRRRGWNG